MKPRLPDPQTVATAEWQHIQSHREYHPHRGLERILADSPGLRAEELTRGLEAFHRERMARLPNLRDYPEAGPWVEHVLLVDRELQRLSGFTDLEMALKRSVSDYLKFRGYLRLRPAGDEHCRVAYLPESDHGQIHIKNIDDPIENFIPAGPLTSLPGAGQRVVFDGVGSGLHLDDEPAEIFPLPALRMAPQYADDVKATVAFLRRYSVFWGGCNQVIHDWQGNSVAIEKCSHNFMEVFPPDRFGRSHCSGMTCRDPESPQGRYQEAKRRTYLEHFNQPADGPDACFWNACRKLEAKLADGLLNLGAQARSEDLLRLFTTGWPEGLNKNGLRVHPRQGLVGYTLVTQAMFFDERRILRWQRDPATREMPPAPETFVFCE